MRSLLFLLIASNTVAQVDLEAERRAMLNGDVNGVILRLEKALDTLDGSTDPIQNARILETLGEQYHRLSDIGQAKILWDEALHIRQQAFGDSSAEAAVGYTHRARYHNYMSAPQGEHQPVAWVEADRALHLSARAPHRLSSYERVLIQREAGYAWKVAFRNRDADLHEIMQGSRRFYRKALLIAQLAHDTIAMAQIIHDIGNTFTDEVDAFTQGRSRAHTRPFADSALACYDRSIALMRQYGMGWSEAVMMDHFTTALMLYYGFRLDSLHRLVGAYDAALRTMLVQAGRDTNVDPLTYAANVGNKAQMVELLTLRATALANYRQPDGPSHLPEALAALEAAVPYWEAMLREYRSTDFYKVVGSYHHFPYLAGTRILANLHRETGDPTYLHQALQWFDRNRNALEQREIFRANGRLPIHADLEWTGEWRTTPGTACVAIHDHFNLVTFTIDPEKVTTRILDAVEWLDFNTWNLISGMQEALRRNDPMQYRRNAFRIYQATIAPALADPSIREIAIIPSEGLDRFPFEALVTDTSGPAAWDALRYVNQRCVVRYARSINEALMTPATFDLDDLRAVLARAPGTSELPFAAALVRDLGGTTPFQRSDWSHLFDGRTAVHLASHAMLPTAPDAEPYFQLTDGPLHMREVDSTRGHAPFVVLSTCSSAEGRYVNGVGTLSLGHALLRNGSYAVVQTLWPVDDEATSEILELMYEAMHDGSSAAEALATAKRAFFAQHQHDALASPYYWSGIILTGRAIRPETYANRALAWGCGIGLLVLSGGLTYRWRKRSINSRAFAARTTSPDKATASSD